jgi:SAM-dependent methyltransferase
MISGARSEGHEGELVDTQEALTRDYYKRAGKAFKYFMGDFWHHGFSDAEDRGLNPEETAIELADHIASPSGPMKAFGPGDYVLDFGTGPGGTATRMALTSGATIVGVSNNAELTEQARQVAEKHNATDRAFFLEIGDEYYRTLGAWRPETFDAITFFESVCHLPTEGKRAFFKAAFQRLVPGGRLIGIDWCRRPYGTLVGDDQIMPYIEPVNYGFQVLIEPLDFYAEAIAAAGFTLAKAEDMWEGKQCWGSTPDPANDPQGWSTYDGEENERFANGKLALDAARAAGVFTVGLFEATKPH